MLPAACVAIHVIASRATPVDTEALLARCNGILGDGACRVVEDEPAGAEPACWQAAVTLDERGARAVVAVHGSSDDRATHRDVDFAARDQVADRWATLGLVVAALVTIEESSTASKAEPAPAPARPSKPPAPKPADVRRPAPTEWREPMSSPSFGATLSGVAAIGMLPGAALGLRLEGSMSVSWFGALIRGAYTPPRSEATVPVAGGTGGGRFSAWSAGAGVCARTRGGAPWTFRGCAGGSVEATTATGFGVQETSSATALTGTAWLGPAAELQLARHVAVMFEADALVASQRPEFSIRGASTVYTPSRFGADLALGLTAVF